VNNNNIKTVNYSDGLNVLSVSTLLLYNISKAMMPFVNEVFVIS